MTLKGKLGIVAGCLAIIFSIMYLVWPVGHIPLYDANLVRLAETELQGYCSGDAYYKSGGYGDANLAAQCRAANINKRSNKIDLLVVQRAFCQAIVDNGWQGTVSVCLTIMSDNQYWPTYDGFITNSWNRARPYPQGFVGSSGTQNKGSRTGGHNGNQRENNPTHTTPSYG